jgi:protein-S-isoprenylcysteine O-methyltransferase Ste14
MNNHAAKEIALAIFGLLFVLSGIAGITSGGTSAQAGWWLIVVGTLMGVVGLAALRTRHAA